MQHNNHLIFMIKCVISNCLGESEVVSEGLSSFFVIDLIKTKLIVYTTASKLLPVLPPFYSFSLYKTDVYDQRLSCESGNKKRSNITIAMVILKKKYNFDTISFASS